MTTLQKMNVMKNELQILQRYMDMLTPRYVTDEIDAKTFTLLSRTYETEQRRLYTEINLCKHLLECEGISWK